VREAAADVELQFVAFSSATLVVSPFEAGEVCDWCAHALALPAYGSTMRRH